ncbi:conserved Plasmodium protein, unknown function [Plasmodium knowlesi strain H]|uniref:Uncharacterized protein n=3 Tax=Plasmodium knowlesi TaxID=5850 RepID=A0A5K1V641_PLAKH|nr:conserved Plasmodium protein, unknown function [Plasmodium knowlesi strain H]OTN65015.1 Uncharacterized protein PKNOH_S120122200 [Plasmodium knowlesi]CAA9988088.1 conserved Plasmodium protein, unknown function [Plasmodium knowlesi strain H]SBO19951.1 conserved Plasmodium protein, unknown function [Plasmodium knowlesi strain H]SBO29092.1 conserved Plasmodium protein, unknown function [Plasmodium knowlesi strain H]VVS77562.1 conserved Plasmodium protein, unknown function [Plasmodium knowlesi |eukprot:XP_002259062.1 hypothetical protein, conserved in Plasmodium species [Plasmodium knowlesi strain H]
MSCLLANYVERKVSHFFFPFHFLLYTLRSWFLHLAILLAVLHGVTLCKSGQGVDASRVVPAVPPIFSVISSDVKLENQGDYVRRSHHHQGVKLYEQVRNKCKVYFLPLVWPCGGKGGQQGTNIERDNEGNSNRTTNKNVNKTDGNTADKNSERSDGRTPRGNDETPFEYLEKNIRHTKHEMENLAAYVAQSDAVIVPMNYHDILNTHLLDIAQFSNFLNVIDLLLYVNQTKDNHNVIFYIYNFHEDDDASGGRIHHDTYVEKEKASIVNIVQSFLRNHWKDRYDKCIKEKFFFARENTINMNKWNDQFEKKKVYYRVKIPMEGNAPEGKITPSESSPTTRDHRIYSIFENHRPDALKKLTSQNYFVYNFFSNLRISILHEYLKLSSQLKVDNFDPLPDAGKMKIKMNQVAKEIDMLISKFLHFQLNKSIVRDEKTIEQIKRKQHSYLVHIIITDLLEKYEHLLENLIRQLYQLYRQRIKKIKITSNMINEFSKEIKKMDNLFHLYNSSMSFVHYFKNKEDYFLQRANSIALHMQAKLLQMMNETTTEIVNYYISQGVYVRNYNFTSSFLSLRKYSFFSYMLQTVADMFKNRISLSFNYLSPSAFGFSSYKDDLSLSPKRDLMITTSEMDQVEKINIPTSTYSKILLSMERNKR